MENMNFKPQPRKKERVIKEDLFTSDSDTERPVTLEEINSIKNNESFEATIDDEDYENEYYNEIMEEESPTRDWEGLYSQDEIDDQEYAKEPITAPNVLEYDYNIPKPSIDNGYTQYLADIGRRRDIIENTSRYVMKQQTKKSPTDILNRKNDVHIPRERFKEKLMPKHTPISNIHSKEEDQISDNSFKTIFKKFLNRFKK